MLISTNSALPGDLKQFPVCPGYTNQTPPVEASMGSYSLECVGSNAICILKGRDPNLPHTLP